MIRTGLRTNFVTVAILLWYCTTECVAIGLPLLVFPPTSPTRIQMISGIGIPVDLNFESVTIGYVIKVEYFLPENASNILNILNDPFDVTTRPISDTGRKWRQRRTVGADTTLAPDTDVRVERYDSIAVEVDAGPTAEKISSFDDGDNEYKFEEEDLLDDDTLPPYTMANARLTERNNLYAARFTLYHSLEAIVQRNGLPGRPCMLRSICEAAHAPFSYHNGILGEIAHIVMSPSTSSDPIIDHADGEYLRAEQLGRAGEPCGQVFRECPVSMLDKISGMYNMMDGIMNVLG